MKKSIIGMIAGVVLVTGCTSGHGLTYHVDRLSSGDGANSYRVLCAGLLQGPQSCVAKAREICAGKPVTTISAVGKLADDGVTSNGQLTGRELMFSCGAPPPAVPVAVAPVAEKPPVPAEVPQKVVLTGDANFDFDSAVLTPRARTKLDDLARLVGDTPLKQLRVIGYTDSIGSAAYNQSLSTKRAGSVYEYLRTAGIRTLEPATVAGMGATRFVDTNSTAAGRAANRRVEIELAH